MATYLKFSDVFNGGKYDGENVRDVVKASKKKVMSLLKQGYNFDDEVLESVGIKRTVRDVTYTMQVVGEDEKAKLTKKKYSKDTEKAKDIISKMNILDIMPYQDVDSNIDSNNSDDDDDE